MPKLPSVKARELLKILRKLGFCKHHQSGSHIQLKHPDGRRVTVPFHSLRDIRRGTLKGILDDINLSAEEFLRLRHKR